MNRGWIAVFLLGLAAVFLFGRLGHYALWDDEALIALAAKGVVRTGDTTAVIDHNLVAYRSGLLLRDLHDRSTPPLSAFMAAPFLAGLGDSALAARLPFALCGFGTVLLILGWLQASHAGRMTWLLTAVALAGNVSFFLYSRQSRYYAPAILLSVAIVFLYTRFQGRRWVLLLASSLSLALLAANYLNYFALYACLAMDYLLWARKERRLRASEWALLLIPQAVGGAWLLYTWNPFFTGFGEYVFLNRALDRLTLLWWNFRDLNRCEFAVGGLLLAAPILYLIYRELWLLRALVALLVYVVTVTMVSPQVLERTSVADVRYLVPAIPLGIFIGVTSIRLITARIPRLAVPLAFFAFGTNLLSGEPLATGEIRSTLGRYVEELINPPSDPYRVTAQWVRNHVQSGQSIWVVPSHMTYPLIFHAPEPVYAWQLQNPSEPQFRGLDPIHFQGQVLPDYIIAFGPVVEQVERLVRSWEELGEGYESAAVLDHFWRDVHRPELFWRSFSEIRNYDRTREAIQIFRRD